ncbi:MAG: endonuclease domain-containing protein [Gammaproteobacteria bacterium]
MAGNAVGSLLWKRRVREDFRILSYDSKLKVFARRLRSGMTEAELRLWSRLRRKQICGVQFYRQKPIGPYIVDFYAPAAKLVVEVDGSQHLTQTGVVSDMERGRFLRVQGLQVIRFDNVQVLKQLDAVVAMIHEVTLKYEA